MSNGDPTFWVRAEYAFMLNVLETADQMGGPDENRIALLQAAREQIRARGIPDEPKARAAVTTERQAALRIIDEALRVPVGTDPLGRAWTAVVERARDWTR